MVLLVSTYAWKNETNRIISTLNKDTYFIVTSNGEGSGLMEWTKSGIRQHVCKAVSLKPAPTPIGANDSRSSARSEKKESWQFAV